MFAKLHSAFSRTLSKLNGSDNRVRLFRGGVASVGLRVGSAALTLVSTIVLARTLGAEGYGVYAYVFAIVSLLAVPAQLGLPVLVVRETARADSREDRSAMKAIWTWSNRIALVLSGIVCSIGLVGLALMSARFSQEARITFIFGLISIPIIALANLRSSAIQGLGRVLLGQFQEFILRPGLLSVLVLLTAFSGVAMTPFNAMGLHVLAASAGLLFAAVALKKVAPAAVRIHSSTPLVNRAWFASTLPLAAIAGIQLINLHVGVLIVGAVGDASDVGIYRVVMQGGTLLSLSTFGIGAAMGPVFARTFVAEDWERLRVLAMFAGCGTLALTFPVAAILVTFPSQILEAAFGNDYIRGATALSIIALGRVGAASFGCIDTLMPMTGHERAYAFSLCVSVTINVLLHAVLVPALGLIGAAVSAATSLLIWNILLARAARKKLSIDCFVPTAAYSYIRRRGRAT